MVSISSAAVPVFDQIAYELEQTLRTQDFSDDAIAAALDLQHVVRGHALGEVEWRSYLEERSRALDGPAAPFAQAMPADSTDWRWAWWARVGDYDPVANWARSGLPTLIVYGEEDSSDNVPVATSVKRLEDLARRPGVGQLISYVVYPGLGHTLIAPNTGWISAAVLDRLADFVTGNRHTP